MCSKDNLHIIFKELLFPNFVQDFALMAHSHGAITIYFIASDKLCGAQCKCSHGVTATTTAIVRKSQSQSYRVNIPLSITHTHKHCQKLFTRKYVSPQRTGVYSSFVIFSSML